MRSARLDPPARWMNPGTRIRLKRLVSDALRAARASGSATVLSLTDQIDGPADPSAIVAGSRTPGEHWFCFEQPDGDRFSLAALGSVIELQARGEERFEIIAAKWRELVARAVVDARPGPPCSGLTAVGGFAFAPEGGTAPTWTGFAAASLVVPELVLARRGDETWLTVNAVIDPDDEADHVVARVTARLRALCEDPLPLFDPAPVGRHNVAGPMPPAHFEAAVARAVEQIKSTKLEKLVLAREVEVHGPRAHDPAAVLGVLREAYASSFVFAVGRGEATFLGASPELLVRREGERATTVALAGSTRRSADPAVDDHLGEALLGSEKDRLENAIVARRIVRTLRPHSVWVAAASEPVVVRVANIQHLACPIRAQLASPLNAIELAACLHPTPAVGAEPRSALSMIPALEGLDRGWYAGAVGWIDGSGDGEFCVALRSALLRDRVAHCYAGCGIVADSDPAAELAESELKLGVMLPALAPY